jgi:catechol 2,3-dioxygenase-like lactoylglutathione lyase family enzyme
MSDLDHVAINVSDFATSKRFYQQALAALGMKLIMESASGAGFGRTMPQFWLRQGTGTFQRNEDLQPITPVHVCFAARGRAEVDAFHLAALAAGGKDFGPPGLRPHYHAGYYGAFILDPDGHNVEAVTHAG